MRARVETNQAPVGPGSIPTTSTAPKSAITLIQCISMPYLLGRTPGQQAQDKDAAEQDGTQAHGAPRPPRAPVRALRYEAIHSMDWRRLT